MLKKRITSILLILTLFFSLFVISADAFNASDTLDSITYTYSQALAMAGRSSFWGSCNLATAYQLRVKGIYSGQLDYAGGGNQWYDHYRNGGTTSGGYTIIPIGGADCLYTLINTYGNELYNIVVSFGTGGSSGPTHVMLITALVNGYCYFTDSFDYWGVHSEGHGGVLSLEEFYENYNDMNGRPHGCVYFTKNGEDASKTLIRGDSSVVSGVKPVETKGANGIGVYVIRAVPCLLIRSDAGRQYTEIGDVPNGMSAVVKEIKNGWGKVTYGGVTGWICLDYAVKQADPASSAPTTTRPVTSTTKPVVLKLSPGDLFGDVDGDGRVMAKDARLAVCASARLYTLDTAAKARADVDRDGRVTAQDGRTILRASANLETLPNA